jgi:hypothetical protein
LAALADSDRDLGQSGVPPAGAIGSYQFKGAKAKMQVLLWPFLDSADRAKDGGEEITVKTGETG